MQELIYSSAFFGVFFSIAAFEVGLTIKKKFKLAIFNPLLIAIAFVIVALLLLHIDYSTYYDGAKYISYLLTPATVCLAIPLYQKVEMLKNNWKAITAGIVAGVLSSLGGVFVLSYLFGFTHEQYVTLLPKSITTAVGMGVEEELGGIVTITVAVIIISGILGNMFAEIICKVFCITEPIAKGIAIGTASHAMGTAKAMEMGEVEGAMSSLAIAVSGLITVVGASIFANFM